MKNQWKHAIVIGGTSGIGAALARRLSARGVDVAIVGRRIEELDKLAREINGAGSAKAIVAQHDVRSRDEVPALMQRLTRDLGGLDAIFYVAGVMPRIAPDEYDIDKDVEIMEVNTIGAMAWLNEAAKRFEQTQGGTIVGVSSIAGDRGRRGNPAYCTSKAALATYLESLRNRLSRYGVRVVTVKPGFVDTDMTKGAPGLLWVIPPEQAADEIIEAAEGGRMTVYVPGRWRAVGTIVRLIPSFIFRRLNI
ncbi:MAG: SDR family NAD(P)-dependent oxidoreductase [bacterium]|nr:SDR family NAD(P)-dependent oxidoreductase [Candidatus Kapabacteria bacterium]